MGAALPLAELDEKAWDAQLFATKTGLATTLGWTLRYHTLRSKGSTSGFPDRVLVRDRVIFAELKKEGGKPTDAQRTWLTGLAKAGAEVYLWRPSDLEEAGAVLGKRWQFIGAPEQLTPTLSSAHRVWTPGSLWLPAGHRHDATIQQELVA